MSPPPKKGGAPDTADLRSSSPRRKELQKAVNRFSHMDPYMKGAGPGSVPAPQHLSAPGPRAFFRSATGRVDRRFRGGCGFASAMAPLQPADHYILTGPAFPFSPWCKGTPKATPKSISFGSESILCFPFSDASLISRSNSQGRIPAFIEKTPWPRSNPFRATLKPWLKPLFVGISRVS